MQPQMAVAGLIVAAFVGAVVLLHTSALTGSAIPPRAVQQAFGDNPCAFVSCGSLQGAPVPGATVCINGVRNLQCKIRTADGDVLCGFVPLGSRC